MHIKAANVFVDSSGFHFLGDFGSSTPIDETIVSCTTQFLPEDPIGRKMAHPSYDWFMLVVMIVIEAIGRHSCQGTLMKPGAAFV